MMSQEDPSKAGPGCFRRMKLNYWPIKVSDSNSFIGVGGGHKKLFALLEELDIKKGSL